jgi:hypothetical protein
MTAIIRQFFQDCQEVVVDDLAWLGRKMAIYAANTRLSF